MAKRTPHRKTGIIKHKVADGIYLLRFKTQYELTSTFLRVQEHYELPQFHGRIFTLEQYMDWYVAENGAFTYFQDWSGFNVPSTAFQPFYEGKFDPLTRKEKRLLGLFRNLQGRFYVIGIYDSGKKGPLPTNSRMRCSSSMMLTGRPCARRCVATTHQRSKSNWSRRAMPATSFRMKCKPISWRLPANSEPPRGR